jgi:hypothetical protein
MSKADGDPRARGASPADAEAKNVKPAASTIQDDIPPVHVLEAAERQERKETEDLLSGFDRPGRSPKAAAPRERDFVDYYAKKPGGAGSASGSAARAAGSAAAAAAVAPVRGKQGDVSTVIVRRKGDGAPAWLVWGGAALLMLVVGGVVAFLATADGRPEAAAPAVTVPSNACAATTLSAATTPKPTSADESVAPPAVAPAPEAVAVAVDATTTAAAAAPRGTAKREPRSAQSGAPAASTAAPRATTAAEAPKAAPREDFIRDL